MQDLRMRSRCTQGTKATPGRWERTHVRDRARIPKATPQIAFVQQSLIISEETYLIPSKRVATSSYSFELNFRAQSADED